MTLVKVVLDIDLSLSGWQGESGGVGMDLSPSGSGRGSSDGVGIKGDERFIVIAPWQVDSVGEEGGSVVTGEEGGSVTIDCRGESGGVRGGDDRRSNVIAG